MAELPRHSLTERRSERRRPLDRGRPRLRGGRLRRALFTVFAGTPNRLMATAWGSIFALYYFGPVTYHHVPTAGTWIFICLCMFAFVSGGWLSTLTSGIAGPRKPCVEASYPRIARIAAAGAWLGAAGIAAIAADKLLFSGLDYSQGITSLRVNQNAEMLMAGAVEATRTPLLYLGYTVVTFSVPSYLIFLLRPEAMSRRVKWIVHAGVLSPVGIAILYGGRSPIVFVCALVVGAMIVRSVKGQQALPYSGRGAAVAALAALSVVVYVHYIFSARLLTQGLTRYEELVYRFEFLYNATPSPLIEQWLMPYLSPAVLMTLLNSHLYFTHEFFVLDLTLTYDGKLGPYFGHHQFYLLSVLIERFAPSLSLAEPIRSEAQAAGVFGWFSSAWGGMYLDFGYGGALAATAACGYASAAVFREAIRRHRLAAELIACYVAGGVLVSPIMSPFTVSISLPILTSILGCAWLIDRDQNTNRLPAQMQRRYARTVSDLARRSVVNGLRPGA